MDYFLKLVKGEKFFLCKDFDKVSKKNGRMSVTIVISDHFAAKLAISRSPFSTSNKQMNLKVIRMHFRLKAAGEGNYIPNKSIKE